VNVATQSRAPVVTDWAQRYQVVARIGAGGFAEVYEAIDLRLEREVALKIVDERHGVSARVAREVEAAASLTHPGIVALYDFFTDGRRAYLVWELVRGRSLAELAGGLDDGEATEAVAQVLEALAYAHGQGVVHRDVKPQNVMVDEHGYVKVMDFGIARLMDAETLTSEGDMLGTVAYMSPE
jgi:eukaryotic-like serine/threonine-protein kinase